MDEIRRLRAWKAQIIHYTIYRLIVHVSCHRDDWTPDLPPRLSVLALDTYVNYRSGSTTDNIVPRQINQLGVLCLEVES
jgi:hypothetical protein